MCGVVGVLGSHADLNATIGAMSAAVAHRGPDDAGTWFDPDHGLALGHRRLSIVDLSPAGHQPMTSRDGRWVLVLNGEIYDHEEHRANLERTGVRFRGHSDTEVLLELIARVGVAAAVTAVDGMFALAAWDRQERLMVLARDRLGEKPLYYGRLGSAVVFASELGAIRALPGSRITPDPAALGEYLRWGFVPSPLSIVPGISKLPPGSTVRISASGELGQPQTYWSLTDVAAEGLADPIVASDEECVESADAILRRSVARRLEADVPVGAFLSGGVDSSTIVALGQAVSSRPIRTFTVAVGGDGDESAAAAAVAAHLGTDHTTLPLDELEPLDLARRASRLYDEPFADPSAVPTSLLCAAARQHVTVCLSGDGGDEILGGYNRYRVASGSIAQALRMPRPLRAGAARALTAVSPATWERWGRVLPAFPAVGTKAHKLGGLLYAADPMGAYAALTTQWDPSSVLMDSRSQEVSNLAVPDASALDLMMLEDQRRTLPDDMLVKVDRASMAVALEVRVPFLSHEFVEMSWRLPTQMKVRAGQGKWLVREILRQYVPENLWDRPKQGFDPPLAAWLRGPLREWSHDLLSPERLRRQGVFHSEPILKALAEHESGARNHDYPLWTMLMLQSWLDEATS